MLTATASVELLAAPVGVRLVPNCAVVSPIVSSMMGRVLIMRSTMVWATHRPPAPPLEPVSVPVLPVVGWSVSAEAELGPTAPPPGRVTA